MKKVLLLVVACASMFMLTGCGENNEPTKTMKCTRTANESGIKMDLSYNISYKGDYVTLVESNETVTIDDKATLEAYQKEIQKSLDKFKDIQYYDTNLTAKDNSITSTIKIDYTKIDINKLIEIEPSMKVLFKDGKIKVADMETLYSSMQISCQK